MLFSETEMKRQKPKLSANLPDPMKYLESVSEIGPRPTGSAKEKEASQFAKGVMESLGLEVLEERFQCNPSMFRPHILVFLLVIAMGALPMLLPNFFVGCFLAALGCYYARKLYTDLLHNRPISLMKPMPEKTCPNIIGKVMPRGKVKNRIVLLSHLDTAICSPIFSEKMVRSLRMNIMIDRILFSALAGLYLAAAILGNLIPYYIAVLLSLYVVGSLLVLLYSELFSPNSPGVNDNGSGISAVLAMAEGLKANPLENTEVWCVCLGAEESGALGSKALWEHHHEELKESYILNIDTVAVGKLRYLTNEGYTEEYPCDPEMVGILERLQEEQPKLGLTPLAFKGWGGYTDCTNLLQNGCRATTLVATESDGFIKNWHTMNDTLEGIQKDTYQKLMFTVDHLVRELDAIGPRD